MFLIHPVIELLEVTEASPHVRHFINGHGFVPRCSTGQHSHHEKQQDSYTCGNTSCGLFVVHELEVFPGGFGPANGKWMQVYPLRSCFAQTQVVPDNITSFTFIARQTPVCPLAAGSFGLYALQALSLL
jgi:hypothetical protein